jgi:hypothetical protein
MYAASSSRQVDAEYVMLDFSHTLPITMQQTYGSVPVLLLSWFQLRQLSFFLLIRGLEDQDFFDHYLQLISSATAWLVYVLSIVIFAANKRIRRPSCFSILTFSSVLALLLSWFQFH